jgi:hypothetical protein
MLIMAADKEAKYDRYWPIVLKKSAVALGEIR